MLEHLISAITAASERQPKYVEGPKEVTTQIPLVREGGYFFLFATINIISDKTPTKTKLD